MDCGGREGGRERLECVCDLSYGGGSEFISPTVFTADWVISRVPVLCVKRSPVYYAFMHT